ncbi:MAG: porin family protein [Hyphomicrobiales bacterium]|nr:MAG: porin family protein [Hyphomicrobiales bacterium]
MREISVRTVGLCFAVLRFSKLSLSTAAVALVTSAALAADDVAASAHDWSGFYLGVFGSVAAGQANIDGTIYNDGPAGHGPELLAEVNALNDFPFTDTMAGYGIQAGYNVQLDNIMLGIQADLGALNLNGSAEASGSVLGVNFVVRNSFNADWLLTLRPRVGLRASDNLLIYASGGLALSSIEFSHEYLSNFAGVITEGFSESYVRAGWVVGAGIEYALDENWSLGAEYLYTDLGSISETRRVTYGAPIDTLFENELDLSAHALRTSVNYRF